MELISLRENNYGSLKDLFAISWKIRKFIAISAYTDIHSIQDLFTLCKKQKLNSGSVTVQIFIDRSAKRNSEELLKIHKKIQKEFDKHSGLFLVSKGSLFHSKCYLVEGDTYGKFFLGSMNLTKNGYSSNEEILVKDDYLIESKSAPAQLARKIICYADGIRESSTAMDSYLLPQQVFSLRELLLDGKLYHENAEKNPLSFDLSLPNKAREIQSTIPELTAIINNSITIKKLIERTVAISFDGESTEKSKNQWKTYCIETCYGHWSPNMFSEKIQLEINKAYNKKDPLYSELRKVIINQRSDIDMEFKKLWKNLVDFLGENNQLNQWKYRDFDVVHKAWSKWYNNIEGKISNEQYFKKLISNIISVPAPDVWSNPEDGEEFENSFCDSLSYALSNGSKNKVVKAFEKIGMDNDIDKVAVEKILAKYKNNPQDIFKLEGL